VDFWGDGTNPLPLVLVDDVADALVRALDAPNIIGEGLLVTGPPLLTAREYVDALSEYTGTKIDSRPRSPLRNWTSDLVKELAKNAIRHPNRRWPTLRDWRCSTNLARYDSRMTEQALGWHPVSDRETLVKRGIKAPVDEFFR
jgi:nucleoside-diphosphate-sugar epimerase